MVTEELNKESFNEKYSIINMNNNSITIENKASKTQLFVHKRVLNAILKTEKTVVCTILPREYKGRRDMWLATFFTI